MLQDSHHPPPATKGKVRIKVKAVGVKTTPGDFVIIPPSGPIIIRGVPPALMLVVEVVLIVLHPPPLTPSCLMDSWVENPPKFSPTLLNLHKMQPIGLPPRKSTTTSTHGIPTIKNSLRKKLLSYQKCFII